MWAVNGVRFSILFLLMELERANQVRLGISLVNALSSQEKKLSPSPHRDLGDSFLFAMLN